MFIALKNKTHDIDYILNNINITNIKFSSNIEFLYFTQIAPILCLFIANANIFIICYYIAFICSIKPNMTNISILLEILSLHAMIATNFTNITSIVLQLEYVRSLNCDHKFQGKRTSYSRN